MTDAILVLNAGSSSIKFSLFAERGADLALVASGQVEGIDTAPRFVGQGRRRQAGGREALAGRASRSGTTARSPTSSTGCRRARTAASIAWPRSATASPTAAADYVAPVRVDAAMRREAREAGAARAAAPAAQPGADPRRAGARAGAAAGRLLRHRDAPDVPAASSRCSRCPRSSRTRACAATAFTACRTSTSPRCCRSFDERAARGQDRGAPPRQRRQHVRARRRPQHRQHDGLHRPSTACRWGRARARSIRA